MKGFLALCLPQINVPFVTTCHSVSWKNRVAMCPALMMTKWAAKVETSIRSVDNVNKSCSLKCLPKVTICMKLLCLPSDSTGNFSHLQGSHATKLAARLKFSPSLMAGRVHHNHNNVEMNMLFVEWLSCWNNIKRNMWIKNTTSDEIFCYVINAQNVNFMFVFFALSRFTPTST